MFRYTIDNKPTYTDTDGDTIVDLTKGSLTPGNKAIFGSVFKVIKEYEMRPDLVSYSMYGTDEYVDLIMKYSDIPNPFAVEVGDLVFEAGISHITDPVDDEVSTDSIKTFDTLKNYHKYIDSTKVPSSAGSETSKISTANNDKEANISYDGDSGIQVINGRIYFGDVPSSIGTGITDIDTNGNNRENACAASGLSLGQFLTKALNANT